VVAAGLVAGEGQVELRSRDLRAVIADNAAYAPVHRAGLNGVSELQHRGGENLLVPAAAALNFEHVFSGDSSSYAWDIFEPRKEPMALRRLSPTRAQLMQERTEHWPLRTTLTYELAGPDEIDFSVDAVPLEDAWRKHGYVGLFFASYIAKPED